LRRGTRNRPLVEERPQYRLIRSKRRTCALEIAADGRLIVRAPYCLDDGRIELLVRKHGQWIETKRKAFQQSSPLRPSPSFHEGDKLYFLGKGYPLRYVEESEGGAALRFDGRFLLRRKEGPRARVLFREWCRLQAREILSGRAQFFGGLSGLNACAIRITDARKRWGSCSTKGTLNFTWRLVMAPLEVIDYVVVHELMHLKEQNHSKRFWQSVRTILPDFDGRRRRLRELEHSLLSL
jgi:predicted metal-dependent hydrolase